VGDHVEDARGGASGRRWVWPVALLLVGLVYVLRVDHVCGLYVDDAWYVLLARALASGKGYALVNVPTPGIVPFYPPGFPLVLSLAVSLAPRFPDDVWVLKSVSVLAMLGVALLTRRYGVRVVGLGATLATAIAIAVALHPGFVYLATATVMSECVFTLVQVATVLLLERSARRGGAVLPAVAGGVGAGFALLTRSMAAGLVGAGALFLLKERRWRATAGFVVAAVLVALPWMSYARAHAPTPAQQLEVNDYVAYPYSTHFWMAVAGHPEFGMTTAADLPMRTLRVAQVVATRDVGALAVYPLYRLIEPGDWASSGRTGTTVSLAVLVLAVVGFVTIVRRRVGVAEILTPVSLAIILAWPFLPFRFVLTTIPFVLCYVAVGAATVARRLTGGSGRAAALAVVVVCVGASVLGNGTYLRQLYGPPEQHPRWQRIFDEHLDVIRWTHDHVPPEQIVAATDPALVYLYDGHRTVGYWQPRGTWAEWRRLGVHYLVDTSYLDEKPATLAEGQFETVHRSATLNLRVLDLHRIYEPH
jgi:hypothetical protein